MFFSKKREERRGRKKSAAEEARRHIVDGLQKQFDAAQACADPADAFIRLEALGGSIDTLLKRTRASIEDESLGRWMTVGVASAYGAIGLGGAIAMSSVVFPPSLLLLAIPAFGGGVYLTKKSADRARQKAAEEQAPFTGALAQLRDNVQSAADGLLAAKLESIAGSPNFATAANQAPRLRDHVMAAFAKRAATQQPPPPAPPRGGGLQL